MSEQQAGPPRTNSGSTVPVGSTEGWRDRKRILWLIGLVVPSLAFVAYGGWLATGSGLWFWVGPVVILVIVPAVDLVAGLDRANPPDDAIEALEEDRYYRWVTYSSCRCSTPGSSVRPTSSPAATRSASGAT